MAAIERACWGTLAASQETLNERLRVFSDGTVGVIDGHGILRAFATAVRIADFDVMCPIATWRQATDSGLLSGVLDLSGRWLYGVNLSAEPGRTAFAAAQQAFEALLGLTVAHRCKGIALGCRIPRYYRWAHLFSPDDYKQLRRIGPYIIYIDSSGCVKSARGGPKIVARSKVQSPADWPEVDRILAVKARKSKPLDPQLSFYESCRCCGQGIDFLQVLPMYFDDPHSKHNGVLLAWRNPYDG
jgi:hypothetical protein